MLTYLIQRLLQGILVIFLVSLLTFIVMQLAPGDPIRLLVGEAYVTPEQLDLIRAKWGLDDPWYVQYWTWISNLARGDLGTSIIRQGVPISEMVSEAASMTIRLNIMSFSIALCIAIPVGVFAAIRRYSWFDYGSMLGSTLGVAVPNYWIGLMAIVIFSVQLGWLPPYGADSWRAYILPVFVLAIEEMAALARLTRGATIEVMSQDFVTTSRAKGLMERAVIFRHIVRNALLPVITIIGYRVAFILSGTIVVETVFAWPGLGRLFYNSIQSHDFQVVQAIVILLTVIVVVVNILTDLTYAIIDPRVRVR
ncbi:MAG: ABC transporter permease [Chloroflexia bacterium]|jgi:ABC-type dipeptide/oligopeptide/nickel transport system permease component|nr:ABC transporter permease [Chloroflexia bacterium]MDQ3613731.1 ABC transporter permease [Chloroflexota bacterium]